jgi:tRNA threonylcarbamoyladenosine biosynthesis protein TsaE
VPSTDDTELTTPLLGGDDPTSLSLVSRSLADTALFADELARVLLPADVVLLIGDLGAGKTAFTKALARSLAVEEPITSPTFTIMRTYDGRFPGGSRALDLSAGSVAVDGDSRGAAVVLAHLDAYRLDHADAIEDLGLFELLDRGAVAVIEWGDLVAEAFDTAPLVIRITTGTWPELAESSGGFGSVGVDPSGDVLDADGDFEDRAPRHISCSAHPSGPWQARLLALATHLAPLLDPATSP